MAKKFEVFYLSKKLHVYLWLYKNKRLAVEMSKGVTMKVRKLKEVRKAKSCKIHYNARECRHQELKKQ